MENYLWDLAVFINIRSCPPSLVPFQTNYSHSNCENLIYIFLLDSMQLTWCTSPPDLCKHLGSPVTFWPGWERKVKWGRVHFVHAWVCSRWRKKHFLYDPRFCDLQSRPWYETLRGRHTALCGTLPSLSLPAHLICFNATLLELMKQTKE